MRILVLGAGGTGGYFGGRLVQGGADVTFLVRPARAEKLAAAGLRIESPCGDFSAPVQTLTSLEGVAPFDLILLSCKAYDLDSAIASITPGVGPDTRILPLLNGLKHFAALDAAFGSERVLGGLCLISATLGADGEIRHLSTLHRLTFGNRSETDPSLEAISAVLGTMAAEARCSTEIGTELWEKFAFLATLAGITCLLRAAIGDIAKTDDGQAATRALLHSCNEVARRSGFAPRERSLADAEAILCATGSALKASMLRDIERGGPTEGEHILGDMLARAQQLDVPAEVLRLAHCHVQAYERTRA